MILIGADLSQFLPFIWLPKTDIRAKLRETWPGPTTWLLPSRPAHNLIRGKHHTVAVRVPGHAQARKLCELAGMAIVSTSANQQNQPPARSVKELSRMRLNGIDFVLPGGVGKAQGPSTMINAISGEVLRQG